MDPNTTPNQKEHPAVAKPVKTSTGTEEKKQSEELKIMEWRFNQFLGEKLQLEDLKNNPENDSFLVTDVKFSPDGLYSIVSDKGGRLIIFKKSNTTKSKNPKLAYHYEFAAQEKEFDRHKSCEYTEAIRSFTILENQNSNNIDILSAGYRNIKLDRVYNSKCQVFDTDLKSSNSHSITVPKLKETHYETKHKTRAEFKAHNSEIKSISESKVFTNNFISADEFKVLLWDLNCSKQVYNPIDLETSSLEVEIPERITVAKFCGYNPSIFGYGTSKGVLKICDLRTSSDCMKYAKTCFDENSGLNKTVFANSILSVHDINFNIANDQMVTTRHYLSVNYWDLRNLNAPTNKFLLYEPIISKLSYLYQNNYMSDKFSLSSDPTGKVIITGGYNNMFHIIDCDQKLNTQIVIDENNEKIMNTNVIRKINSKGSCFYKKDDPSLTNINFDKKILYQAYSPIENYAHLILLNCIYSYTGSVAKKSK